jgi:hypothetical protein
MERQTPIQQTERERDGSNRMMREKAIHAIFLGDAYEVEEDELSKLLAVSR